MKLRISNAYFILGIKSNILFIFILCYINVIYAQDVRDISNTNQDTISCDSSLSNFSILSSPPFSVYRGKEQNIIPPSPTAASLGRYGEIPVKMYSGTPNIDIPLFEIESIKLSLTVSMSYQATGVKVEEIPGWVGSGWALNAGGVITRSVIGLADEGSNGYLSYFNNIPNNFANASCQFLVDIAAGAFDTQPDMFFFNFAGRTGKFVLGDDGEPKLIPYQKLEISKHIGNSGGFYGITGFTIKTPDGTIYKFEASEVSSISMAGPNPGNFYSSWYLTKIISSDLKDTINLTYTSHHFTGDTHVNQTIVSSSNCTMNWTHTSSQSPQILSVSARKLSTIESQKGKIVFTTADRTDCSGGKKLTSISLYSKDASHPYKSYTFSYTDVSNGSRYVDKRMFLDNITAKDSLNSSINKYTFNYNNRTGLPSRDSKSVDYWGFYNGAYNRTLVPASTTYGFSGANREPNESKIKYGILEKITYPTGGYTQFIYEAHKNSITLRCGGVRIKEIHNYDGITTTKRKYTYGTGILFSKPVLEYPIDVRGSTGYDWCRSIIRQSFSHTNLGTSNGSYMGYSKVTEWIGLSGEGGKIERTYNNIYDQGYTTYPFSPGTPFDWARGHLLNEKKYSYSSGSFTLAEETSYDYGNITGNPQNSYNVKGLKVGYERFEPVFPANGCYENFTSQRYQEYYYYSRWFYLKEKTKKTYLAGGTATEDTKYYYANPNHAQITKKTETTSTGDSICTFYYYPDDYPTLFSSLKTNFVVGKPIDVRVYFNSQLISGQQFAYNNYGLPTTVYQARISSGGSIAFNSSNPYTFNTLMNIKYNSGYNIQEITPVNDYPITYLWSYGDTYPVMKIENASYSQVSSLAGSLISDLQNTTTPSIINTKLSQIRSSLSSISTSTLITSYKYRSHIGITEISDPTDTKTKYSYDKFGRLNFIKNDEDKLLNQFIYNYVNK
nr:hypothetical protein [uncultured Draconibacterium sp.]